MSKKDPAKISSMEVNTPNRLNSLDTRKNEEINIFTGRKSLPRSPPTRHFSWSGPLTNKQPETSTDQEEERETVQRQKKRQRSTEEEEQRKLRNKKEEMPCKNQDSQAETETTDQEEPTLQQPGTDTQEPSEEEEDRNSEEIMEKISYWVEQILISTSKESGNKLAFNRADQARVKEGTFHIHKESTRTLMKITKMEIELKTTKELNDKLQKEIKIINHTLNENKTQTILLNKTLQNMNKTIQTSEEKKKWTQIENILEDQNKKIEELNYKQNLMIKELRLQLEQEEYNQNRKEYTEYEGDTEDTEREEKNRRRNRTKKQENSIKIRQTNNEPNNTSKTKDVCTSYKTRSTTKPKETYYTEERMDNPRKRTKMGNCDKT